MKMCLDAHVFHPEGALPRMLLSGSNVELAFLEAAACVFGCCVHMCVCVKDTISWTNLAFVVIIGVAGCQADR